MTIIVQITDSHVVAPSRLVRDRWATGADLRRAVAAVLALDPRPDVALLTGDLVNDGAADSYAEVAGALEPLFAAMPVLAIPGNHDDRAGLRAALPDIPFQADCDPFCQIDQTHGGLRLIGLDTVIPGQTRGELCQRRLDWLDQRLSADRRTPTLVALHHPPFLTGIPFMDDYGLSGRDDLAAVLSRHGQVIRLVSGHLHRQIAATVAGIPTTICPGTSLQVPLKLTPGLPTDTAMDEPPAVHLHCWTGATLVTHTLYIPRDES